MIEQQGKILIVDDESSLRRALCATLASMGFSVNAEPSGEAAIESIRLHTFDAVLLDINMPGMGGFEACRTIRKMAPFLNIIMLTVRDQQETKVAALDAGADDYVTKPFQTKELAARLRAAVRRSRALRSADGPKTVLRAGDLELDVERRELTKAGVPIRLTPKEFDLLHYLMAHPGIPVMHSTLLRAVWGPEYGSEVEYLRTFMRQLRKKMGDDASEPLYLKTEPYIGYRFLDSGHKGE